MWTQAICRYDFCECLLICVFTLFILFVAFPDIQVASPLGIGEISVARFANKSTQLYPSRLRFSASRRFARILFYIFSFALYTTTYLRKKLKRRNFVDSKNIQCSTCYDDMAFTCPVIFFPISLSISLLLLVLTSCFQSIHPLCKFYTQAEQCWFFLSPFSK